MNKTKKIMIAVLGAAIVLCVTVLGIKLFMSKEYTIKFNTDGGNSITSKTIKEGEVIFKPKDPVKKGYTFDNWYLNGKVYDFNTKVKENITLKAKWLINITVSFETVGGNAIESLAVPKGGLVKLPTPPIKENFTFVEWQLNGTTFDFNLPVEKDIVLTALWVDDSKLVVTFDSNGGSVVAAKIVTTGNKVSKPKTPTKNGYTFGAWQLNGKNYNFSSLVTASITLKATWKAVETPVEVPVVKTVNKYTVTFDCAGGTGVANQTVNEGSNASKPANPSKIGYTIEGWLLNGNTYNFGTPVTKDITLVAKWKLITYGSNVDQTIEVPIMNVLEHSPDVEGASIGIEISNNASAYCTGEGICDIDGWELYRSDSNVTTENYDIIIEDKLYVAESMNNISTNSWWMILPYGDTYFFRARVFKEEYGSRVYSSFSIITTVTPTK